MASLFWFVALLGLLMGALGTAVLLVSAVVDDLTGRQVPAIGILPAGLALVLLVAWRWFWEGR